MADIFLSYSKQDTDAARLIAALLEARGYSVWWDASLLPGDQFHKVIMKELEASKAVIVLWTENSVKSPWVLAEAGNAQVDRKIITLKSRLLSYNQIPFPFDQYHTTNFDNHEAIIAAVEAQLDRPTAKPELRNTLQSDVFTWFGIVGGALVIVNHWSNFVTLADWMRWLSEHWIALLHQFWSFVAALIKLSIPKEISIALSMVVFYTSLSVGTIIMEGRANSNILRVISVPFVVFGALIILYFSDQNKVVTSDIYNDIITSPLDQHSFYITIFLSNFIGALLVTEGYARYRFTAAILCTVFAIINLKQIQELFYFTHILPDAVTTISKWRNLYLNFLFALLIILLPVILAPTRPLIKRLAYLLIGVALIFGLSELSKQVERFRTRR